MWSNLVLDFQVSLPIIWWALVGILVLILSLFVRGSIAPLVVTILGLIAGIFLEIRAISPIVGVESVQIAFNNAVRIDNFFHIANTLGYIICLATIFILIPGLESTTKLLKSSYEQLTELLVCLVFGGFGFSILVSANDLTSLFIGLETFSISLYCICGFYRTEIRSTESAFKYLMIGAFSTVLLLYGLAFLYGATGATEFGQIRSWLENHNAGFGSPFILLSSVFLVAAFGFKLALVPFHFYTPDVYEGAPTPITGYLATMVKVGTVVAAFRIFELAMFPAAPIWETFWIVLCVLSVLIANIMALQQRTLKKLLALSSVSHSGFLGLALLVTKGGVTMFPLVSYLVVYSALSLGAFAIITYLEDREKIFEIESLKGLGQKKFWTSAVLSIFILGMAGFPPFAGFMIKFWVLEALIREGYIWVSLAAVTGALIGAAYYLRILMIIFMSEESGAALGWSGVKDRIFSLRAVVILTAILALVGGLRPQIYADWIFAALALK